MIGLGYKAQRLANRCAGWWPNVRPPRRRTTVGTAPVKEQVIHFINKEDARRSAQEAPRARWTSRTRTTCPSSATPLQHHGRNRGRCSTSRLRLERLFSQVGLAAQAMLWHAGVQTVLPPGYLCCGCPQRGAGLMDKAEKMITDNRCCSTASPTLNYLDIKTVVVSCGTCR